MDVKSVVLILNQMEADKIFEQYALGGAVGATFYLEPVTTYDVDVFVRFTPDPDRFFLSLEPLYHYLQAKGHSVEGEYVMIAGTPVQFLPPVSQLGEEAIGNGWMEDLDGLPVRLMRQEHLAALALATGRPKDKARLLQFLENPSFDRSAFNAIVTAHQLQEKWQHFQNQFLK